MPLNREFAIALALADEKKRAKLRAICLALGKRGSEVRYGVAGPSFDIVAELIETVS